jgi:hydroxymethylpyrimidine/phosphomethylpyrimidine kinase
VIKGGHRTDPGKSVDLFYDGQEFHTLEAARCPTRNTHGSGCTFAAAITAYLALGSDLVTAVRQAKGFVTRAILHSFPLGQGSGPLGHIFVGPVTDAAAN